MNRDNNHPPASFQVAILAAGDYPTHPVPLTALHEADIVVCCDSAYFNMRQASPDIQNYLVIGDGDSLSVDDKQRLGDRYVAVGEQDYNDLHKAMVWATSHYPVAHTRYTILGATGLREDHTLGNISYLATFADEYPGIDIVMYTNHGTFTVKNGEGHYRSFARQQVSIFSLTPDIPVSVQGLAYPIEQRCIRHWWEATLNEAVGDTFTVSGGTIIVFQTYEPKA